jgi:hypothetical protein
MSFNVKSLLTAIFRNYSESRVVTGRDIKKIILPDLEKIVANQNEIENSISTGSVSTSLSQNHIFVGSPANVATDVPMSGDATINSTGVLTLVNTAVTPGTYGNSTNVAQFTVDSKGRLTFAGNVSIGAETKYANILMLGGM